MPLFPGVLAISESSFIAQTGHKVRISLESVQVPHVPTVGRKSGLLSFGLDMEEIWNTVMSSAYFSHEEVMSSNCAKALALKRMGLQHVKKSKNKVEVGLTGEGSFEENARDVESPMLFYGGYFWGIEKKMIGSALIASTPSYWIGSYEELQWVAYDNEKLIQQVSQRWAPPNFSFESLERISKYTF